MLTACLLTAALSASGLHGAPATTLETRTVTVAGKPIKASVVRARLSAVEVKVALAKGLVARTEPLASMAKRAGALAAINGCFFDAYTSKSIKNLGQTVIANGRVVHLSNTGCIAGFTAEGEAKIERIEWTIEGSRNGRATWPDRWYAYWINRLPTSRDSVILYTPEWGASTGQSGLQVSVSGGHVSAIGTGSATIPKNGYVVLFLGSERKLGERFRIGETVDYRIRRKDGGDESFWAGVREAMGCGPTLLHGGKVAIDLEAERFADPKILTLSAARSALGLTRDGQILLVAASGTIRTLAEVMRGLGCSEAMNLDGGASSGLWHRGQYVRTPGRDVATSLLLLPKAR